MGNTTTRTAEDASHKEKALSAGMEATVRDRSDGSLKRGPQKRLPDLDVARQPRVKMIDHAGYRYLLHLDGQSCSSRLEQLMTMGSVVLKEEVWVGCDVH